MKAAPTWLQATLILLQRRFRSRHPESGPPVGFAADSLDATGSYWFSMFAASALGTNMGDFWVDNLSLARGSSFVSLAVISGLAIAIHSKSSPGPQIAFWVAIVTLRAAATNVADYLTHDLRFNYVAVSIFFALASLLAGHFTRLDPTKRLSPAIDHRYWITMFIAGMFGTIGGDLASHTIGPCAAAAALCSLLVATLALRRRIAPSPVTGYWTIVLIERCAGTPAGDGLASSHALDLGLPLAMACTGGMLAAGLACRAFLRPPTGGARCDVPSPDSGQAARLASAGPSSDRSINSSVAASCRNATPSDPSVARTIIAPTTPPAYGSSI